jgi:hypothetical protein
MFVKDGLGRKNTVTGKPNHLEQAQLSSNRIFQETAITKGKKDPHLPSLYHRFLMHKLVVNLC